MSVQTVLNIMLCIAGFLGGWVLNTLWKTVIDLQKADTSLAEKVASIEILVERQRERSGKIFIRPNRVAQAQ